MIDLEAIRRRLEKADWGPRLRERFRAYCRQDIRDLLALVDEQRKRIKELEARRLPVPLDETNRVTPTVEETVRMAQEQYPDLMRRLADAG